MIGIFRLAIILADYNIHETSFLKQSKNENLTLNIALLSENINNKKIRPLRLF